VGHGLGKGEIFFLLERFLGPVYGLKRPWRKEVLIEFMKENILFKALIPG
jgi:hypothetical protein